MIRCVETCSTNEDCEPEPCCSFGYCTGSTAICTNGMKEDFDICDSGSECKSDACHNNRCASNIGPVKNNLSYIGAGLIVVMLFIITIASCFYSKSRNHSPNGSGNDYYRRARSNGGDIMSPREREARRAGSRERSESRERTSSDQYFAKRDKGDKPSKRSHKKKRKANEIQLRLQQTDIPNH